MSHDNDYIQYNYAEQIRNFTQYKTSQQSEGSGIKSEPSDYIQKALYAFNPHQSWNPADITHTGATSSSD
ncbi:unnamed protein product [Adineta steineri]|uniref:Uncharacterized protein n=1 Tax=Adineta steineri TaxID=433720 RepID=A0A814I704_9BILA|nr:unnamed protein product [Adineta steineri]CAF1008577.1 unnamed protein product [Adineta steineri]CAF1017890.1 unnamed protein product [Adineta steineri]